MLTARTSWTARAGTRVRWATSRVAATARACPSGGAATAPATAATTATRRSATWPPGSTCAPTPGAGTARHVYIYICNIYKHLHCSRQNITEGREVVFQCRDEGPLRAGVAWRRGNGLPLPPGTRDHGGRLEMPNIQVWPGGVYHIRQKGFPPPADRHGHLHLLRHGPTRGPGRGRGLRLPSSGTA